MGGLTELPNLKIGNMLHIINIQLRCTHNNDDINLTGKVGSFWHLWSN